MLTVYNQDRSIRAVLRLASMVYDEQVAQDPRQKITDPRQKITDPGTVRGFTIVILRSIFGREPTEREILNQLQHMRTETLSALFHGYGWSLELNGEKYSKD